MPPRVSSFSSLAIRPTKILPPSPITFRVPSRAASFNRRPRPNYNRFGRTDQVRYLWQTSPLFRNGVALLGLGGGTFYVYNLEQVPISGRRQFNCVSEATVRAGAASAYREVMQEFGDQVLPSNHPDSVMVDRVMRRLIPASGLGSEGWEVRVIDDEAQQNAFVIPGGKVFVFSGLLPICQNEAGLAAVLGHEIAHNLAKHSAEKMSQVYLLYLAIYGSSLLFGIDPNLPALILNYAVSLPGSRKQEMEADQLGLLMMARSCYDPREAVGLWQRMAKAEKYAPPQLLSTHPSDQSRIRAIEGWLPEAEKARESSGCGMTSGFMQGFMDAFGQSPSRTRKQPIPNKQPIHGTGADDDDDFF